MKIYTGAFKTLLIEELHVKSYELTIKLKECIKIEVPKQTEK